MKCNTYGDLKLVSLTGRKNESSTNTFYESLILAQDERWRRA